MKRLFPIDGLPFASDEEEHPRNAAKEAKTTAISTNTICASSPCVIQGILETGLKEELLYFDRGQFFLPLQLQFSPGELPSKSTQELIEMKIGIGNVHDQTFKTPKIHGILQKTLTKQLPNKIFTKKILQICNSLLTEIDQEIQHRHLN